MDNDFQPEEVEASYCRLNGRQTNQEHKFQTVDNDVLLNMEYCEYCGYILK